tara:strand:+ start:89 stop:2761 length:2673 start_codon:yes stop_codon:yes gene_type:complete
VKNTKEEEEEEEKEDEDEDEERGGGGGVAKRKPTEKKTTETTRTMMTKKRPRGRGRLWGEDNDDDDDDERKSDKKRRTRCLTTTTTTTTTTTIRIRGVPDATIEAVAKLLREENTIPFIARYRKETTGCASETTIKAIADAMEKEEEKEKTRTKLMRRTDEMLMALTTTKEGVKERERKTIERARERIRTSDSIRDMEDAWQTIKPDGKNKHTRAAKAREKGLETLAEMIAKRDWNVIARMKEDKRRLNETDEEDVWKGARDILSEWVGNESSVKDSAKEHVRKFGRVTCVKVTSKKDDTAANVTRRREKNLTPKERREQKAMESAERYDNFSALVTHVKPHQILAMNRAEANGTLRVKLELDYARQVIPAAERFMRSFKDPKGEQKYNKVCEEQIKMACEDGVKRLVKPWAEREMRAQLKEEALERASLDFAANVKALLLQPPLRPQGVVLALDPGYRAGCKCAVVDKMGNVLETFVCYLHKETEMKKKIRDTCEQHKVSVVAIGDGTASRETETLVANANLNICVDDGNDSSSSSLRGWVVTSEAGASIYSASEIAIRELPNLDVSLRGAVSIARRVQDPLAELVKLDPKHIGVGMYQHDAKTGALDKELDYVVESAVASVGVDLNTASISLLSRVPGMNKTVAKNVVEEREKRGRTYSSKIDAKSVKGCGEKTFEQIAGFLRVAESEDILDRTALHTESYAAARKLLKRCANDAALLETLASDGDGGGGGADIAKEIGVDGMTLKDMAKMLAHPEENNDERFLAPANKNGIASKASTTSSTKIQHQNAQIGLNIRSGALTLSTLKKGQTLSGVVKNVCQFGVFVDVGVETSGLVHRSTFIEQDFANKTKKAGVKVEPHDVARAGEKVTVRVGNVDLDRKRLELFFVR